MPRRKARVLEPLPPAPQASSVPPFKADPALAKAARAKAVANLARGHEGRAAQALNADPRTFTGAEVQRQLTTVEQLILGGYPESKIVEQCHKAPPEGLGISKHRVRALIARARERWIAQDAEARKGWKSEAILRLHRQIREASGIDPVTGAKVRPPNFAAIRGFEQLLADIQGTRAPIQVDVDVQHTEAIMNVIVHLEPEEAERIVTFQREQRRLAGAYIDEHPENARSLAPLLTTPTSNE